MGLVALKISDKTIDELELLHAKSNHIRQCQHNHVNFPPNPQNNVL